MAPLSKKDKNIIIGCCVGGVCAIGLTVGLVVGLNNKNSNTSEEEQAEEQLPIVSSSFSAPPGVASFTPTSTGITPLSYINVSNTFVAQKPFVQARSAEDGYVTISISGAFTGQGVVQARFAIRDEFGLTSVWGELGKASIGKTVTAFAVPKLRSNSDAIVGANGRLVPNFKYRVVIELWFDGVDVNTTISNITLQWPEISIVQTDNVGYMDDLTNPSFMTSSPNTPCLQFDTDPQTSNGAFKLEFPPYLQSPNGNFYLTTDYEDTGVLQILTGYSNGPRVNVSTNPQGLQAAFMCIMENGVLTVRSPDFLKVWDAELIVPEGVTLVAPFTVKLTDDPFLVVTDSNGVVVYKFDPKIPPPPY